MKKTIFPIITVLGIFLIFEGVLRILNIPDDEQNNPLCVPHSLYHHFHVPNSIYVEKGEIFYLNRKIYFNRDGLRGKELNYQGSYSKIIFIGDSFVEARQVDVDQMFGGIIQEKLRSIEIINVGCSSWSSILYFNWLKDNLQKIRNLKHVYLFYFFNDLENTMSYLKDSDDPINLDNITFNKFTRQVLTGNYKLKLFLKKKIKLFLFFSKIKEVVLGQILNITKEEKRVKDERSFYDLWFGRSGSIYRKEAFEKEKQLIVKIHSLLLNYGIKFTIVYIPFGVQVSNDENKFNPSILSEKMCKMIYDSSLIQAMLGHLSRQYKFSFIDLTSSLRDFKLKYPMRRLYNPQDGHFSATGHQVVADILMKNIREK